MKELGNMIYGGIREMRIAKKLNKVPQLN